MSIFWALVNSFSLIILLTGFLGCVPSQQEKATIGACDPYYQFDARTRSCKYIGKPPSIPVNTLRYVNMVEDIDLTAVLTYEDDDDDFATSCRVSRFSPGLSPSGACQCVGGYCTVVLHPDLHYFGVAEFYYSVSDDDGDSEMTLVSVTIEAVDDAPTTTEAIPNPATFLEDASKVIVLGYSDQESGLASACDVTLSVETYAFISSTCSCDTQGVCRFTLSGKSNQYTTTAQTYIYKVKVGDLWSENSDLMEYNITAVNDLPEVVSTVQDDSALEPISPSIAAWSVDFTISYIENDNEIPAGCDLFPASADGITLDSCSCNAPVSSVGTCTLTLSMAPTFHDDNNDTMDFSFRYRLQDGTDASYTNSEVITVDVTAQNDPAEVSTTETLSGTVFQGEEDSAYTVDGSDYDFKLDEGGGIDEDSQHILLKVSSSDVNVVPNANIAVYWGSTLVSSDEDDEGWRDLGDGSLSADSEFVSFVITPRSEQTIVSPGVTITLEYKDNLWSGATSTLTFFIYFDAVKDAPFLKMRRPIVPLFYDKYTYAPFCDNSSTQGIYEDCIRNKRPLPTAPGIPGLNITPGKKGAIFYDYNSGLRYVSTNTDAPTRWTAFMTNCPFSTSREEPGCTRFQSTSDQYLNCVGEASPIDDSDIEPLVLGSYFYDYIHDTCYVSVAKSGGGYEWESYEEEESTVCDSLTAQSGTPSSSLITSDEQIAELYYDGTNKKCYTATWDPVGSPQGTWVEFKTRCNLTQLGCYQLECTQGSGVPTSSHINSSSDDGKLYKDTVTSQCYVAKWDEKSQSGVWVSYGGNCTVGEGSCRKQNCIGSYAPRKNSDPANNMISTAIGNFYYDFDDDVCYKSVGLGRGDWVIYGPGSDTGNGWDLPDLIGNENMDLVLNDFYVDEGGDSTEDDEEVIIYFEFLTNDTATVDPLYGVGDPDLFNVEKVKVYCNGTEILDNPVGSGIYYIDDGGLGICNGDADEKLKNLEVHFTPLKGTNGYGRSEVRMTVLDTGLATLKDYYFSLIIYPIGAIHQGWSDLNSLGNKVDRRGYIKEYASVTLSWDDFVYSPGLDQKTPLVNPNQSDYTTVSITGYNVYRRMAGERFRFDMPLNKTAIGVNSRTFTDSIGNTNPAMGPPIPGTVYYYIVRGVDSLNGNLVAAPDHYTDVMRVMSPPDNMTFVHRWMVNKEMCTKMGQTAEESHDFRCPYRGPGETLLSGYQQGDTTYFDIEYDLLVDRFEAGCPYGETNSYDYIGLTETPNSANDGDIYYSRGSGKCYENTVGNGGWKAFNDRDIFADISQTQALLTQRASLPPLVYMSQEQANNICLSRGGYMINVDSETQTATNNQMLPTRRYQISYSSWPTGTGYKDSEITTLEAGLSLNASSRCNSSSASGLEGYSNQDVPNSGDMYSLPGSYTSGIRSMMTGTTHTRKCISRYGIQDFVGNVKEWVSDRVHCLSEERCEGVYGDHPQLNLPDAGSYAGYSGVYCPYTTKEQLTDINNNSCGDGSDLHSAHGHCIGDGPPSSVVPGSAYLIYYDSLHDECYASTDAATWQIISNDTVCPITPADVETSCQDNAPGIHCIGTILPVTAPVLVGSYFYNLTDQKCYISTSAATWVEDPRFVKGSVSVPSVLNSNYTMRSVDPFYYAWGLDGRRGSCVDNLGVCDEAMTGWILDESLYDARYFIFPLGLPADSDFVTLFNNEESQESLLEIGGSDGISTAALHKDYFAIDSDVIVENDSKGCGAMATGGGYLSGTKAGRYTGEFFPCSDDSNPSSVQSIAVDRGFRCMITIPWSGFYSE